MVLDSLSRHHPKFWFSEGLQDFNFDSVYIVMHTQTTIDNRIINVSSEIYIKSWKHVALRYGSQPTSTSTLAGKWDPRISLGSGFGRFCQIESKEIGKVLYGKASVDGQNRCFPCFLSWLWRDMFVSISAKAHSWIPSFGSLFFENAPARTHKLQVGTPPHQV